MVPILGWRIGCYTGSIVAMSGQLNRLRQSSSVQLRSAPIQLRPALTQDDPIAQDGGLLARLGEQQPRFKQLELECRCCPARHALESP